MHHISRRFGSVAALREVSLTLHSGKVHGLLGENGAGKTTLMNILYGLIEADRGSIEIAGKPVRIRTPQDALNLGIGMVHQHFMLAGAMTVLDNVLLADRTAGQWIDRTTAKRRLVALADSLGLPIDPGARITDLSVGQQQRVEILKALHRNARVLILDEPTAVLTPAEVRQLFNAVRTLCDQGRSVVFISHKLGEIREICDELTILRGGQVVFEGPAASLSPGDLSRHMVGREVSPHGLAACTTPPSGPMILKAEKLSCGFLHDISLTLRSGEILGIAGVDGNGQQELSEALAGLRPVSSGRIAFADRDITFFNAAKRFDLGLAHIPNDRKREGLIGAMSVVENLFLKKPIAKAGLLFTRPMRAAARQMIDRFSIRTSSPDAPVAILSGGNAQKVILARELGFRPPKLAICMNPVRGLDVAATAFVYEQLQSLRSIGGAILLISSELDELLALCDRIGVLYAGRFTMTDFPNEPVESIGRLMTGVHA